MGNNSYVFFCVLIIGLFTSSCQNQKSENTRVSLKNDSIHYSSVKEIPISIKVNDIDVYNEVVNQLNESLIALVKTSNADKRDIALIASKNDNFLPIRIIQVSQVQLAAFNL